METTTTPASEETEESFHDDNSIKHLETVKNNKDGVHYEILKGADLDCSDRESKRQDDVSVHVDSGNVIQENASSSQQQQQMEVDEKAEDVVSKTELEVTNMESETATCTASTMDCDDVTEEDKAKVESMPSSLYEDRKFTGPHSTNDIVNQVTVSQIDSNAMDVSDSDLKQHNMESEIDKVPIKEENIGRLGQNLVKKLRTEPFLAEGPEIKEEERNEITCNKDIQYQDDLEDKSESDLESSDTKSEIVTHINNYETFSKDTEAVQQSKEEKEDTDILQTKDEAITEMSSVKTDVQSERETQSQHHQNDNDDIINLSESETETPSIGEHKLKPDETKECIAAAINNVSEEVVSENPLYESKNNDNEPINNLSQEVVPEKPINTTEQNADAPINNLSQEVGSEKPLHTIEQDADAPINNLSQEVLSENPTHKSDMIDNEAITATSESEVTQHTNNIKSKNELSQCDKVEFVNQNVEKGIDLAFESRVTLSSDTNIKPNESKRKLQDNSNNSPNRDEQIEDIIDEVVNKKPRIKTEDEINKRNSGISSRSSIVTKSEEDNANSIRKSRRTIRETWKVKEMRCLATESNKIHAAIPKIKVEATIEDNKNCSFSKPQKNAYNEAKDKPSPVRKSHRTKTETWKLKEMRSMTMKQNVEQTSSRTKKEVKQISPKTVKPKREPFDAKIQNNEHLVEDKNSISPIRKSRRMIRETWKLKEMRSEIKIKRKQSPTSKTQILEENINSETQSDVHVSDVETVSKCSNSPIRKSRRIKTETWKLKEMRSTSKENNKKCFTSETKSGIKRSTSFAMGHNNKKQDTSKQRNGLQDSISEKTTSKLMSDKNSRSQTYKEPVKRPVRSTREEDLDNIIAQWKPELECMVCKKSFATYTLLHEHFKDRHRHHEFYIQCCDLKIKKRGHLAEHIKIHIDWKAYKCAYCKIRCNRKRNLVYHMKKMHNIRAKEILPEKIPKYDNDDGESKVLSRQTIKDNDRFIGQFLPIFECVLCKDTFGTFTLLEKHFKQEHPRKECHIFCCGYKLSTQSLVVEHLNRHTHPRKHKCNKCNACFTMQHTLDYHMRKEHNKNNLDLMDSDSCSSDEFNNDTLTTKESDDFISQWLPSVECDVCMATFKNYSQLCTHFKQHHPEQHIYIKCCDNKFLTRSKLQRHIDGHLNSKAFKCKLCGKRYTRNERLEYHMAKQHYGTQDDNVTNETPTMLIQEESTKRKSIKELDDIIGQWRPKLECHVCHKEYKTFTLFHSHYRDAHPAEKCYISCCGCKFPGRHDIVEHIQYHRDPNAFKCPICGRRFMRNRNVALHVMARHGD
ncbi:uncharacterized protein isoform X2 [Musca autumnalis]|uniref:uncharacterized protein isoform X2 n=1 Tax=Musca autumnalis TaxID=221902 RepID=UPI003CF62B4A